MEIDRSNGLRIEKDGNVVVHRTIVDDAEEYVIEQDFEEMLKYLHDELQLKRVVAIIRPADHDKMVEAKKAGMHFEKDVVYQTHEAHLLVKNFT